MQLFFLAHVADQVSEADFLEVADAYEAVLVVPAEGPVSRDVAAAEAQIIFGQSVRELRGRPRAIQNAAQRGDAGRHHGYTRLVVVKYRESQEGAGQFAEQRLQYFDVVDEGGAEARRDVPFRAFDAACDDVVVVRETVQEIRAQKIPFQAVLFRRVDQARDEFVLHGDVCRMLEVSRETLQHIVFEQRTADEELVKMRFLDHDDRPFRLSSCPYSMAFAVCRQ